MTGVVAFTSFTRDDLPRALTLARGLAAHCPDWARVAVLVDQPAPGEDESWREAFDLVLGAEALYGEDWRPFVFAHEAFEARAAAKGRALAKILADGAQKVFFFSPDIAIFHDLSDLEQRLDAASILLTPHQSEPNLSAPAIAENEARTQRYGVYNLGFFGVCNDAAGMAFARWYAGRLEEGCYDDPQAGLYLDQKCADLTPALFDRVDILRDPGCNVACWNLSRRRVEIARDGAIVINGDAPLKFYQFAEVDDPMWIDRAAGRQLAPYELGAYYERACAASGAPAARGWAYARFDGGAPIARAARRLWRRDRELGARFADPFAEGPRSFRAYLQASRPELL